MEPKVPPGLFTISQISPSELSGREKLDVTIIRSLWQAFFVSRQASNNQMDRRLEYLFWRIWSSETLQDDAIIESLDRLVSRIMETSSETPKLRTSSSSPALVQPPRVLPSAPRAIPHTHYKSQPTSHSKSPLPPILKKPHGVQGEAHKSARLLLQKADIESVTLTPSTPPSQNTAEFHTKDNSSGRKTPKKPQVNANRAGRSSRRRPVFNRRKSSQASIPKAPTPPPSRLLNSHLAAFDPLSDDFMSPDDLSQIDIKGGNELEDSWADVESADVPVPIAKRSNNQFASSNTSLLTDRAHPLKNPEISPAVLEIADKQDPILPQGIQTVSGDPILKERAQQYTEPKDFSFSDAFPNTPDETDQQTDPFQSEAFQSDVPGLTDAKRVPMPESMLNDLITIIEDPNPVQGRIPIPTRPWFTAEHAWRRLPRQHYLYDWMIYEDPIANKQPSEKRLIERGFRKDFADQLAYHLGQIAALETVTQDGLGLLDCGTSQREIWNDTWESDTPTLACVSMESPESEHAESE